MNGSNFSSWIKGIAIAGGVIAQLTSLSVEARETRVYEFHGDKSRLSVNIPPSYDDNTGKRRVFVDILHAHYSLKWSAESNNLVATSHLTFSQNEAGYPTLTFPMSASDRLSAKWNGVDGPWDGIALPIGTHSFESRNQISGSNTLNSNSGGFGFYLDDLDGKFMDQYMASNREYDSFPQVYDIDLTALPIEKVLYTTCEKQVLGANSWRVTCPAYFTTSSPLIFFESPTTPKATGTYTTLSGKVIPIEVVRSGVESCLQTTINNVRNLEQKFGEWPHARILVRAGGIGGGMEYAGGFVGTCSGYVGVHELAHNFFARGLMPANGDAGWVDEAIASWVHNNYPVRTTLPEKLTSASAKMADRDPYRTETHSGAYQQGLRVISYLHHLLSQKETLGFPGGMVGLLKQVFSERVFDHAYLAHEFQGWIETAANTSYTSLFNDCVYGTHLGQKGDQVVDIGSGLGALFERPNSDSQLNFTDEEGFVQVRHLSSQEQAEL